MPLILPATLCGSSLEVGPAREEHQALVSRVFIVGQSHRLAVSM